MASRTKSLLPRSSQQGSEQEKTKTYENRGKMLEPNQTAEGINRAIAQRPRSIQSPRLGVFSAFVSKISFPLVNI